MNAQNKTKEFMDLGMFSHIEKVSLLAKGGSDVYVFHSQDGSEVVFGAWEFKEIKRMIAKV
jgi:hypothetical protein